MNFVIIHHFGLPTNVNIILSNIPRYFLLRHIIYILCNIFRADFLRNWMLPWEASKQNTGLLDKLYNETTCWNNAILSNIKYYFVTK